MGQRKPEMRGHIWEEPQRLLSCLSWDPNLDTRTVIELSRRRDPRGLRISAAGQSGALAVQP